MWLRESLYTQKTWYFQWKTPCPPTECLARSLAAAASRSILLAAGHEGASWAVNNSTLFQIQAIERWNKKKQRKKERTKGGVVLLKWVVEFLTSPILISFRVVPALLASLSSRFELRHLVPRQIIIEGRSAEVVSARGARRADFLFKLRWTYVPRQ